MIAMQLPLNVEAVVALVLGLACGYLVGRAERLKDRVR